MEKLTDKSHIQERIDRYNWIHKIDVGHGITTPGRNDCLADWARLKMPESFTGKTVLDIGCADGFFSFECETRGAKKVFAMDIFEGRPVINGKDTFAVASKLRESKVEFHLDSAYELPSMDLPQLDIILFLNVLYHIKNPLLALENIAAKLKDGGSLYLKTFFHQDIRKGPFAFDITRKPIARYYENNELNNDSTNWWAPNRNCLEGMLRTAGFSQINYLTTHDYRIYYHIIK